jgi:hypothetical protein
VARQERLVTHVIVLFNLKAGIEPSQYEAWAAARDLPTVRSFRSVRRFDVLKVAGMLSGAGNPPYEYVELLEVDSVESLRGDIASTPVMAEIAREFREYADSPVFMVTGPIPEAHG